MSRTPTTSSSRPEVSSAREAASRRRARAAWRRVVTACAFAAAAEVAQAASPVAAVEYFHAEFDHYFVTASLAEAAALDAGRVGNGWVRTGQAFTVDAASGGGLVPVCRFWSAAFAPKSSHFFTANAPECALVKGNGAWQYEGIAFHAGLPGASTCPSGTAALYRLYNNGMGGAPNHRYTSCTNIRDRMVVEGWIAEGTAMCVPAGSTDCSVDASTGGTGPSGGVFRGSILLGAPTATSVRANVYAAEQSGTVVIAYGAAPGAYDRQTAAVALTAGTPATLVLDGLTPDTRHYYRLRFASSDGTLDGTTDEYYFRTARSPGSTFVFTVQADSHMDDNTDLGQYRQTLANVLADAPDFHLDLGDTFMCEKNCQPLTGTLQPPRDQATVDARYAFERSQFALVSPFTPLYLVNGNHDGELGWLADGTAANLAVWATLARQRYFANPVPDAFYGGDTLDEPIVGKRAAWYSWQWGDALFVTLDPFWNTKTRSNSDGWVFTLGARQYAWLQETLARSTAKFKFVFIHNLVGGLDGQMRGGAEAAPFYEWGGRNADGSAGFATKRPGWAMPIHDLLVRYGVTAVFHGHDHLYAHQVLDGVVYQEVPQPSARNFNNGQNLAADYHYTTGTELSSSGHLRVRVGPARVTAEYVRSWRPANESPSRINRVVDHAWSVDAH